MSKRRLIVSREDAWLTTHKLRVYIGTENAASLAVSTPAGGSQVKEQAVGNAPLGSTIELTFEYRATDICGRLPVGVTCVDAAGNESSVLETALYLEDPPEPPGRPAVAATVSTGEAVLTWLASPDL